MIHHIRFFFFQAEDGIRDYKVTGVQTCALPISRRHVHAADPTRVRAFTLRGTPLLRDEGASCNAPGMGAVVGWEIIDPLYYGRYGYPHASWAWLRRHAPVAWFEPPGMLPFWAITRYEDCGAILRDHRRFVIAPRLGGFPREHGPTHAPPFRHLLDMDPPRHGRYRNLLSQQFTPKALQRKRAAVGGIVDETLARVADRAQVDFVEGLAAIIPLAGIAEMA